MTGIETFGSGSDVVSFLEPETGKVIMSVGGVDVPGAVLAWQLPDPSTIAVRLSPRARKAFGFDEWFGLAVDGVDDLTGPYERVADMLRRTGELRDLKALALRRDQP